MAKAASLDTMHGLIQAKIIVYREMVHEQWHSGKKIAKSKMPLLLILPCSLGGIWHSQLHQTGQLQVTVCLLFCKRTFTTKKQCCRDLHSLKGWYKGRTRLDIRPINSNSA